MVTCPTCNRDGFESNRSMRSHHTRTHGFNLTNFEAGREVFIQENEKPSFDDESVDEFAAQIEREIQYFSEKSGLEIGSE